jgi:hypothetical protein
VVSTSPTAPIQVLCQDGVAANSWADGPGLEDGVRTHHPATFTVHSVDIDGNPVKPTVVSRFVAKIAGPVNKDIPREGQWRWYLHWYLQR